MVLRKTTAVIAALAVAVLAIIIAFDAFRSKPLESSFFSMNTLVTAEVEGGEAENCLAEIKSTLENLDYNILSRTAKGSAVYKLNQSGEALLDKQTAEYFSALADISRQSGGAFDFTLGAVSDLWDFGGTPSMPDEAELTLALSHSGFEKISIGDSKISLNDKKAVIDFGASGKGIALDSIKACLEANETKRAVVSVGGSVLLYGEGDFTVGIRNPRGSSGSSIATLGITEGCVSTSGSYEQYFEQKGKRYHHILDPETGYPVDNGLISVTVISESGLLSDALSTACFVLGIEEGSRLAEHYGAKVIFITEDNLIYTEDAVRDIITVTDKNYKFGG